MNNSAISDKSYELETLKSYFKPLDNHKKIEASKLEKNQKIDNNFQKILKSDQAKTQTKTLYKSDEKVVNEDGTDLALRKVAEDFEKQILGIMWNMAFDTVDKEFEGGMGEEIFHKELVNEIIKSSQTGAMGDIAQNIYNDLKRQNETLPR